MKKILLFIIFLSGGILISAQVPELFNYQAIVRNTAGQPVVSQPVSLQFTIYKTSPAGTNVYSEKHSPTTNEFGLVTLAIGNGTAKTGDFGAIDWGADSYFLNVKIDPSGGSSYTDMGTTQLLSVPYAMHAKTVENNDDADADPTNELQDLMIDGFNLGITNGDGVTIPSLWKIDGQGIKYDGGKVLIDTKAGDTQVELADVFSAGGKNLIIGDDAYLTDIDEYNTLGIFGLEDPTAAAIKLGAEGPTLSGLTDPGILTVKNGFDPGTGTIKLGDLGPVLLSSLPDPTVLLIDNGFNPTIGIIKLGELGPTLTGKDGKLGLGINDPQQLLHLKETTTDPNIRVDAPDGDGFHIGYNGGGEYMALSVRNEGVDYWDVLNLKSGNVGIGKTDPSTKLDVNGIITAVGGNSTNWNDAFSWGNHSLAGYLKSYTEVQNLADVLGKNNSANDFKISNLADPIDSQDAATKAYVDKLEEEVKKIENTIIAGGFITDADGNVYNTVKIGTQTWMAENLKTTNYFVAPIPLVTDNTEWSNLTTPGYCWYNNDEATYKDTYGALYNWYAVNTFNLCPTGWHVPSDAEWTILTNYLGGESIAGGKLKESGTSHWLSPNTGATNESGYTARAGGFRDRYGAFNDIVYDTSWWSSTQQSTDNAWFRTLIYYTSSVLRGNFFHKKSGFSVRCIKD